MFDGDEAVGGEKRQHHVGRPAMRAKIAADGGEVGRLGGEFCKKIKLRDRRGDEVDRVEPVTKAIKSERV
ncbi:MAG: hypothetical protein EBU04_09040 [Verrucomicrobia bacterium]|nr:hypothetical protein [Verrucomicrobiota bacterium]